MSIGPDPVGISCGLQPGWYRSEEWGEGPYAAGYMPVEEAERLVARCVKEWREEQP